MQTCAEAHGWTKFVSMQNHYNLLYREEVREMNQYYNLTGVGLIPWSPLCRGALARPPNAAQTQRSAADRQKTGHSEVDKQIMKRVQQIADDKGWEVNHDALGWISKRVASPIVGMSSVERMDEVLDFRGKTLTMDEERYLELYEAKVVEGHH
jgi:aryl-alcohol dehydrogenase-like predicted oxidoreductase